jgi:hypothetical protein
VEGFQSFFWSDTAKLPALKRNRTTSLLTLSNHHARLKQLHVNGNRVSVEMTNFPVPEFGFFETEIHLFLARQTITLV